MRGLTILLASEDSARYYSALSLAAANAAADAPARIFFDGPSVMLLCHPHEVAADPERIASGLPTLAQLREDAVALGVRLIACQSGLALASLSIEQCGDGVEAGGLVGLLAKLGEDRLVAI